MKKIVGILAAAAIATSVFAADVSATAKLSSSLLKSNDGALDALTTLNNAQTADYATLFNLAVSSDNAGGGVKYWDGGDKGVVSGAYNVWFKPTDAIKLSFKENGLGLFGQKYKGYYAHEVAKSAAGYGFQFVADAVTLDIVLQDGFYAKPKSGDATIGQLGAKLGYNADFGSVAFLFSAQDTFKTFHIGAGYSGNVGDIGVVFNAGAIIADNTTVGLTASAGGSVDALSWAIDIPVDIILGDKTTTKVGTLAKVTYALDAFKLAPYFEDEDFLAEGDFAAKIGCEITGNVGAASWKVDPHFTTKDKVFEVGFETSIGF